MQSSTSTKRRFDACSKALGEFVQLCCGFAVVISNRTGINWLRGNSNGNISLRYITINTPQVTVLLLFSVVIASLTAM